MKNGNILLIETMSWFQLMYDMSEFPSAVNVGNEAVNNITSGINYFSGISSALTSNVLAIVAYYVVKYVSVIDIHRHYWLILAVVTIPGAVDAILYTMSCHSPYEYLNFIATAGMYFYIRLASIILNFIVCTATVVHLWQRRSRNATSRARSISVTDKMSVSEKAIRTLAFRLLFYPIIQAVSRAAVTWYELQYGFDFDPDHMSTAQFIGMCSFAIFIPSASYGYLAIFLWTQPDAYECLKCSLTGRTFVAKRSTNCSDLISLGSTVNSSLHRTTDSSSLFNSNVIEIDNRPTFEAAPSTLVVNNLSDVDDNELFNLAKNGMTMTSLGNNSSLFSGEGVNMQVNSESGVVSEMDIELPRPSIGLKDVSSEAT